MWLVADLHLMWGDLGVLSSSLDAVRADLDGVDVAGGGGGAAAEAGSMSARRVEAAVSSLEAACAAVGSCYGGVSSGVRSLTAIHQANDQAVSSGARSLAPAGSGSGRRGRPGPLVGRE